MEESELVRWRMWRLSSVVVAEPSSKAWVAEVIVVVVSVVETPSLVPDVGDTEVAA